MHFLKNISFLLFLYIVVTLFIILFILLPREPQYIQPSRFHIDVEYNFTLEEYKNKIHTFYQYIKDHNGFGKAPEGITYAELTERYTKRSLELIVPAFLLTIIISFSIGLLIMKKRISARLEMKTNPFSLLFSLPDFFIFILVQYVFILVSRSSGLSFDLFGNDRWFHFILPSIILSIYPTYYLTKILLTTLTNEIHKDYINTAKSKGIHNKKIVNLHILWNSWPSMLGHTFIAYLYLVSSLPIIELLSAYDGLGYQFIKAIISYDDIRAIAYAIPFISIIFITKILLDTFKQIVLPRSEVHHID
ncbi:oligopeptide transport system permease protein [Bacillus mesophilus]|uniref:ABC transporter permease subunit n=1 Tax=Bacillus mesophilus TaxID=1808955 RepID=A0A6M0QB90_9BACI|nr:ABC transporter permease subunit [Bacillus mesophilus]MBM7663086.1 oligopeptide transport system permease protein [Bacillus mesophilus]NEY73595.1 ABC transporter permease subunit [Bacillus mesophilus]